VISASPPISTTVPGSNTSSAAKRSAKSAYVACSLDAPTSDQVPVIVTAVKYELSEDVFGVVSNTAAYLMNSGAGSDETHPPIAVSGRVEVKVNGKIKKGQRLVSAGNGIARAAKKGEANAFNTIGRALTDKNSEGLGFVEAIVMIR